ncbi:hypothetical protein HDV00_001923 [Rhizophlyctis rosea]|nr:hypothetical protein HDV00_001923 [Rhizophlyctis rosea]
MRASTLLTLFTAPLTPVLAQISDVTCHALVDYDTWSGKPVPPAVYLDAALDSAKETKTDFQTVITALTTARAEINGTGNALVSANNDPVVIASDIRVIHSRIHSYFLQFKRVGAAALINVQRASQCANQTVELEARPQIQKRIGKLVAQIDAEEAALRAEYDSDEIPNIADGVANATVRTVKTQLSGVLSLVREQKDKFADSMDLLRDIIDDVKDL